MCCRRMWARPHGKRKKAALTAPELQGFSTKSSESESGAMNYIIDFIWLPGPDSNQRPSG